MPKSARAVKLYCQAYPKISTLVLNTHVDGVARFWALKLVFHPQTHALAGSRRPRLSSISHAMKHWWPWQSCCVFKPAKNWESTRDATRPRRREKLPVRPSSCPITTCPTLCPFIPIRVKTTHFFGWLCAIFGKRLVLEVCWKYRSGLHLEWKRAFRYQISQNMCFDITCCTGSWRRRPALKFIKIPQRSSPSRSQVRS
jgi:hypothetical protein